MAVTRIVSEILRSTGWKSRVTWSRPRLFWG